MEFIDFSTWLSLLAVLLLAEALTTNFVTIWFALGALAALLASFFTPNPAVQGTIFMVVSIVLLVATLPLVKKMRMRKKTPLNADRNIGRTATVIEPLAPGEQGRVRLDGVNWSAVSAYPLAVGEHCCVCEINSTVLTVEPIAQVASV